MRKRITTVVAASLIFSFGTVSFAQEQKEGQPLIFPKEQVKEHPSDLHMGSDPYYNKEKRRYEGSDQTGYPSEYDPNAQYQYESSTTIKKKKSEPAGDE